MFRPWCALQGKSLRLLASALCCAMLQACNRVRIGTTASASRAALATVGLSPKPRIATASERWYKIQVQSSNLAGLGVILPKGQGRKQSTYAARFEGVLSLATAPAFDGALVAFVPKTVDLSIDGNRPSDLITGLKSDLAKTVLVRFRDGGCVSSCQFDPSLSESSKRAMSTLLSLTQFALPDKARLAGDKSWQTVEEDPIGHLKVRYRMLGRDGTSTRLVRAPVEYLGEPDQVNQLRALTTLTGSLVIVIRHQDRLQSLHGELAQRSVFQGKVIARGTTRISLSLTREDLSRAESIANFNRALARLSAQPERSLYHPPTLEERETSIAKTTLGDSTQAELMAQLVAADKSTDPKLNTSVLFTKLRALAYLKPESSSALASALEISKPQSKGFQVLTEALAAAGTDSSQKALAHVVLTRQDDWQGEVGLLAAVAQVKRPSVELVATVRELCSSARNPDLRGMATMVLGGIQNHLNLYDTPRGNEVLDYLLSRLAAAQDSREQKTIIAALGNSGADRAFKAFEPFLSASDPALREEAVSSLRFVKKATAEPLILQMLTNDRDARVRAEAVFALGFADLSERSVITLEGSLKRDTDAAIRISILNLLWEARTHDASIFRAIKDAAKEDKSEDVRKAAQGMTKSAAASFAKHI